MPYICTTSDPDAETFTFELLPALSDFIEAMAKLVYGRFRQGSNKEYKTIIYEGNKGKNTQQLYLHSYPDAFADVGHLDKMCVTATCP